MNIKCSSINHKENEAIIFWFSSKNELKILNKNYDIPYLKYDNKFKEYLENELNTSNAITLLYELLKDNSVNNTTKLELIKSWDTVLGLDLIKTNSIDPELEKYILSKIEERKQAKINKDFQLADSIREELLSKGIEIKDTREGTTYEIK